MNIRSFNRWDWSVLYWNIHCEIYTVVKGGPQLSSELHGGPREEGSTQFAQEKLSFLEENI